MEAALQREEGGDYNGVHHDKRQEDWQQYKPGLPVTVKRGYPRFWEIYHTDEKCRFSGFFSEKVCCPVAAVFSFRSSVRWFVARRQAHPNRTTALLCARTVRRRPAGNIAQSGWIRL